jgi:oxygen-independent coproporphyrinogen III oxidase
MIGVYVHIPFCRTLCPYCDFVKRPLDAGQVPRAFIDALLQEIESFSGPRDADSIFIGGGTPSLVEPRHLDAVLQALRTRFDLHDAEVTIEANPDDVRPELVRDWQRIGVNRVSLGVQSFDDRVLEYLGRRHGADGARQACDAVAACIRELEPRPHLRRAPDWGVGRDGRGMRPDRPAAFFRVRSHV